MKLYQTVYLAGAIVFGAVIATLIIVGNNIGYDVLISPIWLLACFLPGFICLLGSFLERIEDNRRLRRADEPQYAFWRWWDAWNEVVRLAREIFELAEIIEKDGA